MLFLRSFLISASVLALMVAPLWAGGESPPFASEDERKEIFQKFSLFFLDGKEDGAPLETKDQKFLLNKTGKVSLSPEDWEERARVIHELFGAFDPVKRDGRAVDQYVGLMSRSLRLDPPQFRAVVQMVQESPHIFLKDGLSQGGGVRRGRLYVLLKAARSSEELQPRAARARAMNDFPQLFALTESQTHLGRLYDQEKLVNKRLFCGDKHGDAAKIRAQAEAFLRNRDVLAPSQSPKGFAYRIWEGALASPVSKIDGIAERVRAHRGDVTQGDLFSNTRGEENQHKAEMGLIRNLFEFELEILDERLPSLNEAYERMAPEYTSPFHRYSLLEALLDLPLSERDGQVDTLLMPEVRQAYRLDSKDSFYILKHLLSVPRETVLALAPTLESHRDFFFSKTLSWRQDDVLMAALQHPEEAASRVDLVKTHQSFLGGPREETLEKIFGRTTLAVFKTPLDHVQNVFSLTVPHKDILFPEVCWKYDDGSAWANVFEHILKTSPEGIEKLIQNLPERLKLWKHQANEQIKAIQGAAHRYSTQFPAKNLEE